MYSVGNKREIILPVTVVYGYFFSFVCSENLAALCILKCYETEVPPKQRQDLNDVSMNTCLTNTAW